MKKLITLIFILIHISLIAQIGIGTNDPKGALDITTTNNTSLIVPRVTNVESVTDGNGNPPVNGSMVYDISRTATCFYQNDLWICIIPNGDGTADVVDVTTPTGPDEESVVPSAELSNLDQYGYVVDISEDGNTLAVSAFKEDSNATGIDGDSTNSGATSSGAVYVLTRSSGVWTQQAYIKASNTSTSDEFGFSLSLSSDGNTLAVGAHDEDSSATGINGAQAAGAINSGAAYVFTRSGTTWSQQAYIKASNTGSLDEFGWSVGISGDGNTLAVGAIEDSNSTGINGADNGLAAKSGAVYIFTRSGTTWTQQAFIKASNTSASDQFGHDVALNSNGNTLVVGAPFEDSNATGINGAQAAGASNSGAAYVFTRSGTTWSQQAYIKASNTEADDEFGWSVTISDDGNTVAVGSIEESGNATGINGDQTNNIEIDSGAVYIFTRSGTTWSQQAYVKASNTQLGDKFGYDISLSGDGNTLSVGATGEASNATGFNGDETNNLLDDAGATYVFTRSGITWTQQAYVKNSTPTATDQFGWSVTLDGNGDTMAVGAPSDDLNGSAGSVHVFSGY